MALRKTAKADLKSRYPLYVQIGLVLALGLLLVLFKLPLRAERSFELAAVDQEIVHLEEIEEVQQRRAATLSPALFLPLEVPDGAPIEEPVLDIDQDIDLDEAPPTPGPPPSPPDSSATLPEAAPELDPPPVFELVEQMPELEGGIAALQGRIAYPEFARRAGIEGEVFVQFVVDETGQPVDIRVVRGIGGGCDEAAAEAVRQTRFTPGLQQGRPVRVRMSLPVTFRLGG